jgi:hypothetical protein
VRADSKRGGFCREKWRKKNSGKLPVEENCRNLRSGEKFRQTEGGMKWSERQDLNLSPPSHSQALTKADTQRDAQESVPHGHDLSRVVTAWSKLSPPLKAAILAIVESSATSPEDAR